MQETRLEHMTEEEARKADKLRQEFFGGGTEAAMALAMDIRLSKLTDQGETLVRRRKVGRNDPCPCGSAKKFKRCCVDKVRAV